LKKMRKLVLHRETLRVLDPKNLAYAGGAGTGVTLTCNGCPNTSGCGGSTACSVGCSGDPGCGGTNNCGSVTRTSNEN
jgi:hypothetical protein